MINESIGKYAAAINRNAQSIMSYKLGNLEIKNGQYDFFYIISKYEGITQQELSDRLYIGKSTTAKAVKNLIGSGYIKKENDLHDKRYHRLYLTEKGQEILPLINQTFTELLDIYAQDLSTKEYEQTIATLKKVLRNVHNKKTELSSNLD